MATPITYLQITRKIRDERLAWTDQKITLAVAAVELDSRCDAFVHRQSGAGLEYAVAMDPDVARYLLCCRKGESRKALAAAIDATQTIKDEVA